MLPRYAPQAAFKISTEDFLKTIDKWRAKQEGEVSRAEAIRRLVELGPKAKK